MNNKLALFWIVLMLGTMVLSGCGQTTVEPEVVATIPVEVTPDGVVDMEPAAALNAALTYISEHYGEQAPPPDLPWKTELATPEGMVGSSTFEYSAGEWVITVSFPIVAPEHTIYQVEVSNQATGFGWNGEVDARGQVSEADSMGGGPGKLDPVPPTVSPNTQVIENWYGEVVSNPPGSQFDDYFQRQIYGGEQYGIESLDPEIQAQLEALRDSHTTIFVWGLLHRDVLDFNGTQIQVTRIEVPEAPAPPEIVESEVEGWVGVIGRSPWGFQLSEYFEREDGQRYGIHALDEDVRDMIESYWWSGAQVRVWGRLLTGIPDVEGRQIQVERIQALSGPTREMRNLALYAIPSSSSELPSDRYGQYHAWSAIDSLLDSPWSEGVDGPGIGEWLMLTFPSPIEVWAIGLDVGYDDGDLFYANNRIRRATFVFSSGEQVTLDFDDEPGVQRVPLARAPGPSIEATWVKMIIEDVYPGFSYDDTCLGEILVWGAVR